MVLIGFGVQAKCRASEISLMTSSTPSVAIVSVATGPYLSFWKDMVESVRLNWEQESIPSFVVFTDRPQEARAYLAGHSSWRVCQVPESAWPDSTMLRYAYYHRHQRDISRLGEVVLHVDADMLVRRPVPKKVWQLVRDSGVGFVRHPGYFRPRQFLKRCAWYLGRPQFAMEDALGQLRVGGIGDWETSENSSAFTPRKSRRAYVCGGVWFARADQFAGLVTDVWSSIESDRSRGVIANWHDESHLNRIAAERKGTAVLGPEFCFASGYTNLKGIQSVIEAVDKGSNWER